MRVDRTIDLLRKAEEGSRPLDTLVAQAVGWRKINRQIVDAKTSEVRDATLWPIPDADNPGRIPYYTSNIEAAYLLVQQACPSRVSGFSWQEGSATAQVGETGPRASAATPALALCLATLMALASNGLGK